MQNSPKNILICDYFNQLKCTSCTLLKTNSRLANIPKALIDLTTTLLPWEICNSPFGLRAKARLSITQENKQLIIGLLDKDLKNKELLNCPLHRKNINQGLNLIHDLIKQSEITPYSIKEKTGEIKGLILQTNKNEDHLRIRFVLRSKNEIDKINNLIPNLINQITNKLSISVNIQKIPHQIAEGPEEIHLHGQELLWEDYNDIKIAFPAQSFMQVTPEIACKLYTKVQNIVKSNKSQNVLDLFCGSGGFALHAAKFSNKVLGIEISEHSINAANISKKTNNITNCEFIQADLLNALEIIENHNTDTIICNPPRRGLGNQVLKSIKIAKPDLLIYSSCNVESFLKDFQELSSLYIIKECTPFEMFPLTNHFELLSVLELNKK